MRLEVFGPPSHERLALCMQVPDMRLGYLQTHRIHRAQSVRFHKTDLAGRIAGGNVGDPDGVATECVRGLVRLLACA